MNRIFLKVKKIVRFIVYDKALPWSVRVRTKNFLLLYKFFPKSAISVYTYRELIESRKYVSEQKYMENLKKLFRINRQRLCKSDQISIWIMTFLDTAWACDALYHLFDKDTRFSPTVVLMDILDDDTNTRNHEFIKKMGYRYISADDLQKGAKEPDLVMYPTLYDQYVKKINVGDRKLSALVFCIPYTFWWDKDSDSLLYNHNAEVLWRFYAPTKTHKEMGVRKNIIGEINMYYSGYPKLDDFTRNENAIEERTQIIIIYAPGLYSSDKDSNFSTFDRNGRAILEIARQTCEKVRWIYRPHPQLAISLEKNRVISIDDYKQYEEQWKQIDNAEVSIGGAYKNIFITSSALITDSISFVSTYQYTGRPMLFLDNDNKGSSINEFGEMLHRIIYHAHCDDITEINRFIKEVVINNKDDMKDDRKFFFTKHLDFYNENGCSASEYIYRNICESIYRKE